MLHARARNFNLYHSTALSCCGPSLGLSYRSWSCVPPRRYHRLHHDLHHPHCHRAHCCHHRNYSGHFQSPFLNLRLHSHHTLQPSPSATPVSDLNLASDGSLISLCRPLMLPLADPLFALTPGRPLAQDRSLLGPPAKATPPPYASLWNRHATPARSARRKCPPR